MVKNMSTDYPNTKAADEAVARCAAKAALETQGVFALHGGIAGMITENIFRKMSETRGVKVSRADGELNVDMAVVVRYGVKIPSVAWNIQENVKKKVSEVTGLSVDYVNILVQGIHFE